MDVARNFDVPAVVEEREAEGLTVEEAVSIVLAVKYVPKYKLYSSGVSECRFHRDRAPITHGRRETYKD